MQHIHRSDNHIDQCPRFLPQGFEIFSFQSCGCTCKCNCYSDAHCTVLYLHILKITFLPYDKQKRWHTFYEVIQAEKEGDSFRLFSMRKKYMLINCMNYGLLRNKNKC